MQRWLFGAACFVLVACSGPATSTCVPGDSHACTCADGTPGAQICQRDGTYEACSCVSHDAGTDAGHDAGIDLGPLDAGPPDMEMPDSGIRICDPTLPSDPECHAHERCAIVSYPPTMDGGAYTISYGECVPAGIPPAVEGSLCRYYFEPVPGRPGVNADTCGNGTTCDYAATGGTPRCRRLCDNFTLCRDHEFCFGIESDPYYGACQAVTDCDILRQTGCSGGHACYAIRDDVGNEVATCLPDLSGDVGDAGCGYTNDCAAGTACRYDGDGGLIGCLPYCDTSGGDAGTADGGPDAGPISAPPCDAPASCVPITAAAGEAVLVGAVGVCIP